MTRYTSHPITALFGLMLVALPSSARAQTAESRLEASLAAAARAEIPSALLESKIAEGNAKQIPAERIAAAVEARLEALLTARETLDQAGITAATTDELSITADAIQANVGLDAVSRLLRTAPPDRRVIATAVLTQLVQLGYAPDAAFLRVDGALEAGTDALINLRAEAAAALRVRTDLLDSGLGIIR